jgi:hypothetical protein
MYKFLGIVILSLALSSCVVTHRLVASSTVNGNPQGGVAVCDYKEACLETAKLFCESSKVNVLETYPVTTRIPYWDRWCPLGWGYHCRHYLTYQLEKKYHMRFRCCPTEDMP